MSDQASQHTDSPENSSVESSFASDAATVASSTADSGSTTQTYFDTPFTPEGSEDSALLASQSQAPQGYASENQYPYYLGFTPEMEAERAALGLLSVTQQHSGSLNTGEEVFGAQPLQQSQQEWSYEEYSRQIAQQNSQATWAAYSQQYSQAFGQPYLNEDPGSSSQSVGSASQQTGPPHGSQHATQGQLTLTSHEMTQRQALRQQQYEANLQAYHYAQLQSQLNPHLQPQPVAHPQVHRTMGGPTRAQQERKHKCSECNKFFLRPSALRTHTYTHTGERFFPCPFPDCHRYEVGNWFSVLSNRTRHLKGRHAGKELPAYPAGFVQGRDLVWPETAAPMEEAGTSQ